MKKVFLSSLLCGLLVSVSNADIRFPGHGGESSSGGGSSSSSGSYSSSSDYGSFSGGYNQDSSGSHKNSSGDSGSSSSQGDYSSSHNGGGSSSGNEDNKKDDNDEGMFDHMPQNPGNPNHDSDKEEGKHSDFGEHKPPKGPQFSHAKGSVSAVEIEWKDTTDNELGYKVFRDGELIKILPPNTTEFKDTGLEPGKEYEYKIVPFNEFGDGEPVDVEVETKKHDLSGVQEHLRDSLKKIFEDKFNDDKLNEALEHYKNGESLTDVYKKMLLKDNKLSDEDFVKKLYEGLLGKDLSDSELQELVDKLKNAQMTREEMFYEVVSSDEYKNRMKEDNIENAFDGDEDKQKERLSKISSFVKRFYEKLLDRTPEENGYNYWSEKLAEKDLSAKDIAKQFFDSEEFKSKNLNNEDFVKKAYEVIMGREADQAGVEFWTQKLDSGMSRDELIDNFLSAKEFENLAQNYDIEPTDKVKEFVERFYTKALKRSADPNGIDYWSKELKNSDKSAKEVAKEFFNSKEFKSKNLTDEEFIDTVYETLMGREADESGKNYWLTQLNNGISRDEMIDQFLKSEEFKKFALESGVLIDKFQ